MKTFSAKKEEVKHNWYLIDVEDKIVGRVATRIADILRGKNKPTFTPHVDTGDFVVVVNAKKIKLSGNKLKDKCYYSYSGYPGGLKTKKAEDLLHKNPQEILMHAVRGMLPKNRLARQMIKKLKIYAGSAHPHEAQQPKLM